jgi:hypothetical protein
MWCDAWQCDQPVGACVRIAVRLDVLVDAIHTTGVKRRISASAQQHVCSASYRLYGACRCCCRMLWGPTVVCVDNFINSFMTIDLSGDVRACALAAVLAHGQALQRRRAS